MPEEWQGDLLVAYHGSWNRSEPRGYKIVRLTLDDEQNVTGSEDFIHGWLQANDTAWGRPVDVAFGPNGWLYISDDSAGQMYVLLR